MNLALWQFFRALRWLAWIGFFAWSAYFNSDPTPHLDSYKHLRWYTEVLFFGFAAFAIFAGFVELMMRERAGIPRPSIGEFIPRGEPNR